MKKIELILKSLLFNTLLLFKTQPDLSEKIHLNENSKVLIIRLNRIGDALVTTPLITFIKESTKSNITVLADKKNHFVFQKSLGADKVIVYKKGLVSFFSLIKNLNSQKFDVVIDAHDDVSTTVTYLIAFINAKFKVGLSKSNSKIFTNTIERGDPAKTHVVLRIMNLVTLFGFTFNPDEINITYRASKQSEDFAKQFLINNNLNNKFLIGINISAGSNARFWGVDRFKKLVQFFMEYNVNVLLLSSGTDLDKVSKISNQSILNFYSDNFDKFTGIISKLDLLITPDTSVVHLASAYKIPVFGLYVHYNTADMIWSPLRSEFDCVITEEATLTNMSYDKVINKLKPFFKRLLNAKRNS